jgi:uncharacterized protein (TIGR00290 family)
VSRVALLWSGGKDAALTLLRLRGLGCEVAALVTSYEASSGRVPLHNVRLGLIEAQAAALGLPLRAVPLPPSCPNAVYEQVLISALATAQAELDFATVAAGDIHLADVRSYRAALLSRAGLALLTPLWGQPSAALAAQAAAELETSIVAVDARAMPRSFLGRAYDAACIAGLPAGVDPCGEHGEFHTFVAAMPGFNYRLRIESGALLDDPDFPAVDLLLA